MAFAPLVEARDVRKIYATTVQHVNALNGVSLTLAHGEMVAIMGPSGCGKTTLLNCLSGLDSIEGGEVLIEGSPLSSMSDRERTDYRARHMGFVFQFYNLMPGPLGGRERRDAASRGRRVPTKQARRQRSRSARARRSGRTAGHISPMRCPAVSASG